MYLSSTGYCQNHSVLRGVLKSFHNKAEECELSLSSYSHFQILFNSQKWSRHVRRELWNKFFQGNVIFSINNFHVETHTTPRSTWPGGQAEHWYWSQHLQLQLGVWLRGAAEEGGMGRACQCWTAHAEHVQPTYTAATGAYAWRGHPRNNAWAEPLAHLMPCHCSLRAIPLLHMGFHGSLSSCV